MTQKRVVDLIFTNMRGEIFELVESFGGERETLDARKRLLRKVTSFYWKEIVQELGLFEEEYEEEGTVKEELTE